MDSPVEEIKGRLDIVDVVGEYVRLKKTGVNFSALCPFHSEKSGSFFVSPARQTWRCFGCGKGGDMFTFVEEIEGVEFGDALRILAAKAGVQLRPPTQQEKEQKTVRRRLYDACELAAKFFEKQLAQSAAGKAAKEYLLRRGLSEESISVWRLGYSPDSWQGLHDFLAREGYIDDEIIGAGLAVKSSGGRVYDRFRGRIMFPIFDFNSQAAGFGGRIFESRQRDVSAEPKYLNTVNTLIYDKSRILYGLDRAKSEVRKLDSCVLVEGYTDVIMSAQVGVENVAATSGTALTPAHLKILKRFTDNLILGYDMDFAGEAANRRGIDLASAMGFNVSVARPNGDGKDPADVALADPQEWRRAVAASQTIMDFYFDRAFAAHDKSSPIGRKKIAEFVLPAIKIIPNAVQQAFWLQKLADRMEARDIHYEEYLRQELKKVRINENVLEPSVGVGIAAARGGFCSDKDRLAKRLLVLAVKFPEFAALLEDKIIDSFSAAAKEIFHNFKVDQKFSGGELKGEAKDYFEAAFIEAENEIISRQAAKEEFSFHIERVGQSFFKDSLARASGRLIDAEKKGDKEAATRLRDEFNELAKSVNNKTEK